MKKFGTSPNWAMIHKTETIHNNQSPTWAPFTVNLMHLCGGNLDTMFKVTDKPNRIYIQYFVTGANRTLVL